jgi:hypothetical protein
MAIDILEELAMPDRPAPAAIVLCLKGLTISLPRAWRRPRDVGRSRYDAD